MLVLLQQKRYREAEPPVTVWREEETVPYQFLYEMSPRGQFVLVFPLERTDVVECGEHSLSP